MNRSLKVFQTLADGTTHNSTLMWPHPLQCMAILIAVMSWMKESLAMQD